MLAAAAPAPERESLPLRFQVVDLAVAAVVRYGQRNRTSRWWTSGWTGSRRRRGILGMLNGTEYYLLKTQFQSATGLATAAIAVKFAADADKPAMTPGVRNNAVTNVEGVIEKMEGSTIIIKDAKIVK